METVEDHSARRRTWYTLGGIGLIILGLLAILLPLATSIGVAILLSWVLVFAGVSHLVSALRFRSVGNFVWELILAALCIYVGFYMRFHLGMAMSALVFLLAVYFLVSACSEFALYYRNREVSGSGAKLLHAVLDLVLFALIWVHWPANAIWMVGLFVGVDLLVAGFSRVVSGAPIHSARTLPHRHA